ncbi:MAG: DUF1810 domain-containing protein [Bacteroidales bacterium]|nr:DUF1810 domain-containing protein [Bacteroidales bacterium]
MHDINRFIKAQNSTYSGYHSALQEIKNGLKTGHWIWYIFPQIQGLGHSEMCHIYGVYGAEEAREYLQNETLKNRLEEICRALLSHKGNKSALEILGGIDSKKVKSSMTLFDAVEPNSVFAEVLDAFYDGKRCQRTLEGMRNEER